MRKVIAWALLLAGILNLAALIPTRPGFALALGVLQPGAFTIVATSIAAGIARLSVESSGSRVTHSTTPSSV